MPEEKLLNDGQLALKETIIEFEKDAEGSIGIVSEKLETMTKKKNLVQVTQMGLSVLTTGSLFSVIFTDPDYSKILAIIGAVISSFALFLTELSKTRKFDEKTATLSSSLARLRMIQRQFVLLKPRIFTDDFETIRKSLKDREPLVELFTAKPLTVEEQGTLVRTFSALADRNIRLDVEINPALTAGVQIRMGDLIFDNSYQAKLLMLREQIKEEFDKRSAEENA